MKTLTAALIVLFSGSAFAAFEVSCGPEGCFESGWSIYDNYSRRVGRITCTQSDCEQAGWEERAGGQLIVVECKPGGCWLEGWRSYNGYNDVLVQDVTCSADQAVDQDTDEDDELEVTDCLTHGWVTQNQGQNWFETICRGKDCRNNGWSVHFPLGGTQSAECKRGGCFENGWVLYN